MAKKPPAYVDCYSLPEDDRINLLVNTCRANHGMKVGFVVEDDEKANRYLQKIAKLEPAIQVFNRGPMLGCIAVSVGIPAEVN